MSKELQQDWLLIHWNRVDKFEIIDNHWDETHYEFIIKDNFGEKFYEIDLNNAYMNLNSRGIRICDWENEGDFECVIYTGEDPIHLNSLKELTDWYKELIFRR